ncbi:hypothetical protein DENSPDRAFT_551261 [Dentipellis sp. KUC8613]|nr:hypothetical protein DENSPDRAFT_551261 [Dentipellis sp. KUC8613]
MAFLFSSDSESRSSSTGRSGGRPFQSFSSSSNTSSSSRHTSKRSPAQDTALASSVHPMGPLPRSMQSGPSRELSSLEPSHTSRPVLASSSPSSYEQQSSKSSMTKPSSSSRKNPSEGSRRPHHAVSMSELRVHSAHSSGHHPMPDEFGQLHIKQPYSATTPLSPPQISASSYRTGSGSQSDSATKSRRLHDYPTVSTSKHALHLSPVDFRQPSPTSPGRLISPGSASDGGGSSDRASSPLIASRHDIKRLLSKPAAPSRASTISITSESDSPLTSAAFSPTSLSSMLGSHSERRGRYEDYSDFSNEGKPSKSGKMRAISTRADLGVPGGLVVDDRSNRSRPGSSRGSSREPPASSKEREGHSPRNVLKKRSYGDGLRSASVSASPLHSSPGFIKPSRHASLAKLPGDPSSERSSRSVSALSPRDPKASAARQPSPTPKLTPAGAIARAYKEQNVRREQLAAHAEGQDERPAVKQSGVGDLLQWQLPASLPFEEYSTPSKHDPPRSADHTEEAHGPYYTVFGSTSGRVVAVGSVEDDRLTYTGEEQTRGRAMPAVGPSTASSTGTSVRQSLSRKMSGRFRRPKTDTQPHSTPGTIIEIRGHGRPSLQERRSASLPKERRKSLRLSVDDYVDVRAEADGPDSLRSSSTPSTKRVDSRRSTPVRDEEQRPVYGRTSKVEGGKAREPEKEKEKDSKEHEEESTGGRLWKLVKRISSGGLRDRYQSGPSTPPPPVPAIPKNLISVQPSRATFEVHTPSEDVDQENAVGRFMQSRSSMSAVRPSTAPGRAPKVSMPPTLRRPSTGLMKSGRPSTATQPSSPQSSSDVASTQFFHRTHSNHSSSSSYGGELPPIPKTAIGQWIIPPNELYRLDKSQEDVAAGSSHGHTNQSSSATRDVVMNPLPHPPRRSSTSQSHRDHRSASPENVDDMPLFSTSEPVNKFASRKSSISRSSNSRPHLRIAASLPQSEFGLASAVSLQTPPPRPARSSRRPTPTLSAPASTTRETPSSPLTPSVMLAPDVGDTLSLIQSNDSADGHSNASTAKQANHSPVGQLTFREIDASPRQTLSEQEKNRKWEDLLERSARAGGTLHLGDGGLMSDNLRFSNYSESL